MSFFCSAAKPFAVCFLAISVHYESLNFGLQGHKDRRIAWDLIGVEDDTVQVFSPNAGNVFVNEKIW